MKAGTSDADDASRSDHDSSTVRPAPADEPPTCARTGSGRWAGWTTDGEPSEPRLDPAADSCTLSAGPLRTCSTTLPTASRRCSGGSAPAWPATARTDSISAPARSAPARTVTIPPSASVDRDQSTAGTGTRPASRSCAAARAAAADLAPSLLQLTAPLCDRATLASAEPVAPPAAAAIDPRRAASAPGTSTHSHSSTALAAPPSPSRSRTVAATTDPSEPPISDPLDEDSNAERPAVAVTDTCALAEPLSVCRAAPPLATAAVADTSNSAECPAGSVPPATLHRAGLARFDHARCSAASRSATLTAGSGHELFSGARPTSRSDHEGLPDRLSALAPPQSEASADALMLSASPCCAVPADAPDTEARTRRADDAPVPTRKATLPYPTRPAAFRATPTTSTADPAGAAPSSSSRANTATPLDDDSRRAIASVDPVALASAAPDARRSGPATVAIDAAAPGATAGAAGIAGAAPSSAA